MIGTVEIAAVQNGTRLFREEVYKILQKETDNINKYDGITSGLNIREEKKLNV
jgi:hypothetical protein